MTVCLPILLPLGEWNGQAYIPSALGYDILLNTIPNVHIQLLLTVFTYFMKKVLSVNSSMLDIQLGFYS